MKCTQKYSKLTLGTGCPCWTRHTDRKWAALASVELFCPRPNIRQTHRGVPNEWRRAIGTTVKSPQLQVMDFSQPSQVPTGSNQSQTNLNEGTGELWALQLRLSPFSLLLTKLEVFDSIENLGADVPMGAKMRRWGGDSNLNAGVGEAWAGQTMLHSDPARKLCSCAVTEENLGVELPMGSRRCFVTTLLTWRRVQETLELDTTGPEPPAAAWGG